MTDDLGTPFNPKRIIFKDPGGYLLTVTAILILDLMALSIGVSGIKLIIKTCSKECQRSAITENPHI